MKRNMKPPRKAYTIDQIKNPPKTSPDILFMIHSQALDINLSMVLMNFIFTNFNAYMDKGDDTILDFLNYLDVRLNLTKDQITAFSPKEIC